MRRGKGKKGDQRDEREKEKERERVSERRGKQVKQFFIFPLHRDVFNLA
jgi:hypothetical protein